MMDEVGRLSNKIWSIREVTELDDLTELRSTWDEIAAHHGPYKPFLCFDWFRLWLDHFMDGYQLLILLLHKHGNLEIIAPLLIKQERFKKIRARKVELIGNVYSPIQTFLFKDIDSEKTEEGLSFIMKYLSRVYKNWDVMDLHSIPEEDGTFEIMGNALNKTGFRNKEYFCFGNWYLDGINYPSNTFFANLSKKKRKNIRLYRNRVEKAGEVVFKMITNGDEIETYMKTYFKVYAKSWKKRERVGPRFFMDFTKDVAEKGWLRLGLVFLNDVPIVSGFAIVCDRIAYFEKTAYDEDYKNLGAGSIWFTEMIKYVIDVDNVSVIDFLRGDDQYKRHWVPQRRERKGILLFNNNLKGSCLAFLINRILPLFQQNEHIRKIKTLATKRFFKSESS